MSLSLSRTYLRAKNFMFSHGNSSLLSGMFTRTLGDNIEKNHEYSSSTIIVENSLNVQELPVVIRKIKDLTEIYEDKPVEANTKTAESQSYHLIQAEFKECLALRDIFTLLSKCTKITPNIALGAMERICYLEKNPNPLEVDKESHINLAKGAIVDKLLKVVMKAEDTQTIINALNAASSFIEPYKDKFCDELLLRVIDNRLSIEQLCDFLMFLTKNKEKLKYSEMIDKLWVGFLERGSEINEVNLATLFTLLEHLKDSKKIVLNTLEQKLSELWCKIKAPEIQAIIYFYIQQNCNSLQAFSYFGRWLNTSIHALDDDSLLEIITKFNELHYTDEQIEKAIEKYLKMKGSKIESPMLLIGIMNHCRQFRIRNMNILNKCSDFFIQNSMSIPHSFLKPFVQPFGHLHFESQAGNQFWAKVEEVVEERFNKMTSEDIIYIVLSCLYVGKHPVNLINRIFNLSNLAKFTENEDLKRKSDIIDTAMCLECSSYTGPLLPKMQWSYSINQDGRLRNIVEKINDTFLKIAGDSDKMSTAVSIPHLYSDETNLIDVMLHPPGWKLTSAKNGNTAILLHLPEHYCSNTEQLVGPQAMRMRHFRLLGMKVVTLNIEKLHKYHTKLNKADLEKYIRDCISQAM